MILAVLEARAAIPFAGLDVYLNVAGGLRITEPAADLAVAAALLSAREDAALPQDMVIFGEISLSGALRPVAQAENRLKEAAKLGFSQAALPARAAEALSGDRAAGRAPGGMQVRGLADLTAFVGEMFGAG
jgi:DNA repair protein RadA/Sms